MFSLNFLGISFANLMLFRCNMTLIRPQLSVKNLLIPKGSRRLFSSKNTLSVCLLTYMPTPFLLYGQSHAIAIFDYFCFLQNSTSIHFWLFYSFNPYFYILYFKCSNKSNIYFFDCRFFFLTLKLLLMDLFSTPGLYL